MEISYTGKSGSLLAAVTSVDQTGSYVFDAKIDNKLAAGFHGEYWSTEGDNDTFITIKNITEKPATAWVSLQYDAGRGEYDLPPMVLQAGESHMIDLKMIQKEGMPGASNELLPDTAVYGGMKLREEPGGRHFLIDAVVFNPKTATCGVCGYGCLYPQNMNIPGGTYIIALADSGEVIAVNAHMCDGSNQTGWACLNEFSTDDSAVATVDPWCQSQGFGFTTGSTTIRSVARDVPGPHCGEQTLLASRPLSVVPAVTYLNASIPGSEGPFENVVTQSANLVATASQCNPLTSFVLHVTYRVPVQTSEIFEVTAQGFGDTSTRQWNVDQVSNSNNFSNSPPTGSILITANNKNGGITTGPPFNAIQINVKGKYNSGQTFSTPASVHIECP